jgi:formate/nitrite transporter FocA (FNT family)
MGFVFVVLGKQQLFTESTLTAVLPLFTRRDLKTFYLTARLWLIVLLANLAGTWLFAALLMVRSIFPPDVTGELHAIAGGTLHHPFWSTFLRAVLAGWLIALMVWILPSTRSARLLTIILITYVVALGGFMHVVAASSEVAYAVLSGMTGVGNYFVSFFLPTVLGNIVGGVTLVSLLNHGSIAPEIEGKKKSR